MVVHHRCVPPRHGRQSSACRAPIAANTVVAMRIIDVDAHLHEPLDWVEQTDAELAGELGPPARFLDIASSVFGFRDRAFSALPEEQQPTDRWDLVPPGFVRHLEMTDERQPDAHDPSSGDPFYAAGGRLRFCDERGI